MTVIAPPSPAARPGALRWLAVAAWAGLIWYLSSRSTIPALPFTFAHLDKVVHSLIFGVLGWLVARALGHGGARRRLALAVLLAVSWGALDELHQAFVPGRTSSLGDLAADAFGASIGVALVWLRRARMRSTAG